MWLDFLFKCASRRRADDDLQDEISFHLAERAAELERSGLSWAESQRRARVEFGAVESCKEAVRDTDPARLVHEFFADLHLGVRLFRRNLALSVLALFCLTIGIGANAAVFSWIEGILLRPFPAVAHQDRMMAITGTDHGVPGAPGQVDDLSWPDFQDLRRNSTLFDAFIVDRIMGTTLSIGDHAQRATGSIVSANYFTALGVQPALGRGFAPDEDTGRNAHPVTVISYRLWQDRYHGDPGIVGKTQLLNGVPHTIIGVAPQGFDGTFIGWAMQFWVPASMQELFDPPDYKLEDRSARWIEGYVLLKPGVSQDQAQAELSAISQRLAATYPEADRNSGVKLYPLWETPFNNAGTMLPTLAVTLAVMVFVLLIACANVSNLLLAKGLARRQEMTIRVAVGARRSRLLRQLLTEALVLSTLAAAGGLLFANWARNLLILLLPARGGQSMNLPGEIDWRVLAASALLCLCATLFFGLVPAVHASKVDLAATLKAGTSGIVGGHRRGWVRSGLVVIQVALSFILLVGAGLLIQSLHRMQDTDPGFPTSNLLTTFVDFTGAGYDPAHAEDFQDRLVARVQALPGVRAVSFARFAPFTYRSYSTAKIAVDGLALPADDLPNVDYNAVGPDYLVTMGIPLLSGRQFTRADDKSAPPVAIVNHAMADQYWPGRDPVGGRLQVDGRWLQVVGVAKTTKYRTVTDTPGPFFYVPLRQSSVGGVLQIRTSLPPEAIAPYLAREVHELDANLAPGEVITMKQQIERTTAPQRVALMMTGIFALLAIVLATIGLYGVVSYVVSQSTREFGLRMALGAAPSHLLRLVLTHGLGLAAVGLAAGIAFALAASRLLGYLLYHVSPRDPLTFLAALGAMALAAVLACLIPAWRASRTNPLEALRT